ncbi:hydrogenase nickel incorporation protein HypB [Halalkaliarchaeum desulfuricum]|uniref:Hydrogenase nickel incorporation protein HypB n=1 Tax=Halalkaliarchaeum desulfuricum TaxID=2055893 RepID=A0A343TGN0_9EURY|nr:hydrogenase nickel incorporation protein HypB [Halalkaliarchaeum desulfuricum]AUX08252.1 hydrogenase nickel incorporation protein HypB [Halalkaliarchaeum desulfuricum]
MHYQRTITPTPPTRLYGTARTNRHPLPPVRWLEELADRLGPARAHRFGHGDHGHGESATDAEADVLAAIRERADEIHETLTHDHGVFAVEFVGSTGGGKTKLIEELLERAPADDRIGAIVGDVAGEDDATRLREYGIPVENVNTGKECHLDPNGIETALSAFDLEKLDTLFVENVGNMVCPADFPLGATVRVLVVSTTEGDDVVGKHPLLVQKCDAAVVNKVDLAEAVGTDLDRIRGDIDRVAPDLPVFETDASTGAGVEELADFLESKRNGHDHGHDDEHDHGRDHGHDHGHAVHE